MFDDAHNVHTSATSACETGVCHLQCKVRGDAFFLQMFASTERYILSMEVLH